MKNLEEFFLEPACGHNREKKEEERKKGCSRPKPGSASGGCAFDGAQITLLPIADAVHLVHGPIPCAGNTWDNRGDTLLLIGLLQNGLYNRHVRDGCGIWG